MKMVSLYASPNPEGNSTYLLDRFIDTLQVPSQDLYRFRLFSLRYKGCRACLQCRLNGGRCVLCDDFTEILELIPAADLLLIAAPVYYCNFPAALKALVERTFSLLNLAGIKERRKRIVFIFSQYGGKESSADLYPRYRAVFAEYGFTDSHCLHACHVGKEGVRTMPEIIREAETLARDLSGSYPSAGKNEIFSGENREKRALT
jgi:multimeric flavodoxin WrbA